MSKTIDSVNPTTSLTGSTKVPISQGSSTALTATVNQIMGFVVENANLIDQTEMNTALQNKQNVLVSGSNIKTINGENILGSGNLSIQTTDSRSLLLTATSLQALDPNQYVLGSLITQPVVVENKLNEKGSLIIFDDRSPLKMYPVVDRADSNKKYGVLITMDLTQVQAPLVSGSNIKTINGMNILGGGNLTVQEKLISGTNIKTINGQSLLGSGNISIGSGGSTVQTGIELNSKGEWAANNLTPDFSTHTRGRKDYVCAGEGIKVGDLIDSTTGDVKGVSIGIDTGAIQEKLVSSTNIKTINNQSLLGSGNITISGGSGGQDMGFRAAAIEETTYNDTEVKVDTEQGFNPTDGPIITYKSGSGIKMTVVEDNGEEIGINIGVDTDEIQPKLVSGTSLKTINNNDLLGAGNISVQESLVSGTNIKTINNQSILGSGNISISGGGVSDYDQLSNRPQINNNTLTGDQSSSDLGLQDTLVSGTNIKTINNQSLLGAGNITISGGGGTSDYDQLSNRPQINGHTLSGDMSTSDIGIVIPDVSTKQDTLVSGTNIKTINGQNILGSGNLSITQVQADWNQDNTIAADYIKNKPTIPAAQVQSDWNASSGMGQILNKPNLATVATSGSYNDLTDKPTIPGQVQADWTESDTSSSAYIKHKPSLATVATSGSYNDLSGKPTIPAAPVNADWDEADGGSLSFIKNKPRLATVATSGDYSDLSNTPTIPAAQIQSDWNQTNSAAKDYIKNKPTVPTNTDTLVFTLQGGTTITKTFYTT